MSFKKRTEEEQDASVKAGDYTGGYTFWPWLIYNAGFGYILPILGLLGVGVYLCIDNSPLAGSGAIAIGLFLTFMVIRMYKQMKKGISS